MVEPTPIQEIREAALQYIALGVHPIQLAPPNAPKISDGGWCRSPGKQPVNKAWQELTAPESPTFYRDGANLGLRMGLQPNGVFLICLDVDTADISELTRIAPAELWPETLVAKTGRSDGGYHLLYSWPGGLETPGNGVKLKDTTGNKTKVDLRSAGGQIAVYPSTHPDSGLRYRWLNQTNIAELPETIARVILEQQRTVPGHSGRASSAGAGSSTHSAPNAASAAVSGDGGYQVSDSRFRTVCRRLANRNSGTTVAFERLLACQPLVDVGSRDDTITKMCWALAYEFPGADPASIAVQFESVLSLMHAISPFAAPCDVALKFRTACEKQAAEVPEVNLLLNGQGTPVACVRNVFEVLHEDKALRNRFAYNAFSNQVVVKLPLPWDSIRADLKEYPRAFEDEDVTQLLSHMMAEHRLNVGANLAYDSIKAAAKENWYHPVQEYLLGVRWDGVSRLDTWLTDFLGVEDSSYTRKIAAWWMMSAVMRVAAPGCQADYCLILEGSTGRGKSQALKALASPEWFTDSVSAFTSKDAAIDISGKWIIELSELSTIHSAKDVNVVKSFITRSTDRHRPPYGRCAVDLPRQCVFAGTTNESEYLQDTTGNRRFWPVCVGSRDIDVASLRAVRDQLWAEAAVRVARGEKYYPSTEAERDAFEAEVDKRRVVDSLEDKVQSWLDRPIGYTGQPLTSAWLLENVAGILNPKRSDDARLNATLRKLGFSRSTIGPRHWVPPSGRLPQVQQTLAAVIPLPRSNASA